MAAHDNDEVANSWIASLTNLFVRSTKRTHNSALRSVQHVRLDKGDDGEGNESVVTDANPLPVAVISGALPSGAATLAEQQVQSASLSVLDDWDETNRAAVNIIAGQVGVQGGNGVITALTQRVVLATDDPGVGFLQNIDDTLSNTWSESSRCNVSLIPGQVGVAGGSGAVSALTLRVTLASDDPAVALLARPSSINNGTKSVAASGTAEQLVGSSTPCKKIILQALDTNTGYIWYGGSSIDKTAKNGAYLFPGSSVTIEIDDVNKVYIDADVSAESVSFTYFN